ncbi:SIMPL domain-containing protein [Humidisolicoccus flavus]|uniref:SIMPL domain-containing protein n=1 Tax=Humidisolicoccus flavus TaxID=3111414 RepID=UPI00324B0176
MVKILVRGAAQQRIAAEVGTVNVEIRAEADDPAAAIASAQSSHAAVLADARAFEASTQADKTIAGTVRVAHEDQWVGDGQPTKRIFVASSRIAVSFRDFEALGVWIAQLGSNETVRVPNIEWTLSDETRVKVGREVRAAAVHDAVTAASDFAHAAGLTTPKLHVVADAGLHSGDTPEPKLHLMRSAMADTSGGFEFTGDEISVRLQIEAEFHAE